MEPLAPAYIYKAKVTKVTDGDTLVVDIDLGLDIIIKNQKLRLYGIDCPETRTRNKEEKEKGKVAKAFTQEFVKNNKKNVIVKTIQDKKGKYGRYLVVVYGSIDKKELNNELIINEHAVKYQ